MIHTLVHVIPVKVYTERQHFLLKGSCCPLWYSVETPITKYKSHMYLHVHVHPPVTGSTCTTDAYVHVHTQLADVKVTTPTDL